MGTTTVSSFSEQKKNRSPWPGRLIRAQSKAEGLPGLVSTDTRTSRFPQILARAAFRLSCRTWETCSTVVGAMMCGRSPTRLNRRRSRQNKSKVHRHACPNIQLSSLFIIAPTLQLPAVQAVMGWPPGHYIVYANNTNVTKGREGDNTISSLPRGTSIEVLEVRLAVLSWAAGCASAALQVHMGPSGRIKGLLKKGGWVFMANRKTGDIFVRPETQHVSRTLRNWLFSLSA